MALAELGTATIVGRGLGAYVALMLAGARPKEVRGTVLRDGPGLSGGAIGPTSQSFVTAASRAHTRPTRTRSSSCPATCDRPTMRRLFVRMAVESSGLDEPIAVTAVVRPPWLAAVVDEIGVTTCSLDEALAMYARTTV